MALAESYPRQIGQTVPSIAGSENGARIAESYCAVTGLNAYHACP